MDIGELWVYHPTKFDAIHCGRVVKLGKKVEIKIQQPDWLSGKFKVDRDQLRCPWQDREAYESTVQPFMALSDMPAPSEDEQNAAEIVLVATGLTSDINFHIYGCAETYDAALVARACGVSLETLAEAPGTVVDGNYVAFPWGTLLKLVKRLARTRTETILEYIDKERAFWDERARDNATSAFSGLDLAEYDKLKASYEELFGSGYDMVQQWTGVRVASQRDKLLELQTKYDRLLGLAAAAADNLTRTQRSARLAEEITAMVAERTN